MEKKLQKISYRLQFMNSAIFMGSSNLVNNLAEGIHKVTCKYKHNDKKCKTCRVKYQYCDCFLEYRNLMI